MKSINSIKGLYVGVVGILFVFMLGSCASETPIEKQAAPRAIPEIHSLEALMTELDTMFTSVIAPDEPGAGLLISYGGVPLIAKGYGMQNNSAGFPNLPKTNFRMASVSKQFTALAVLTLVEKGQLNLEDPVNKILGIQGMEGVQVKHLLNHTSGIPAYDDFFENDWKAAPIAENKHVLDWYKINNTPEFEPGSQFEYSNGGYNLLATIVEIASGQNFVVYARENVFRPMGMAYTDYFNLARPIHIENRAYCYEKVEEQWNQVDGNRLNGMVGEGAVYTSLIDYAAYDKALLHKAGLAPGVFENLTLTDDAVLVDSSSTLVFMDGQSVYYHMGWFMSEEVAFHSGGWVGTSTFVMRGLKSPLTIAVFRNSNEGCKELVSQAYLLTKSYLNHTL